MHTFHTLFNITLNLVFIKLIIDSNNNIGHREHNQQPIYNEPYSNRVNNGLANFYGLKGRRDQGDVDSIELEGLMVDLRIEANIKTFGSQTTKDKQTKQKKKDSVRTNKSDEDFLYDGGCWG